MILAKVLTYKALLFFREQEKVFQITSAPCLHRRSLAAGTLMLRFPRGPWTEHLFFMPLFSTFPQLIIPNIWLVGT